MPKGIFDRSKFKVTRDISPTISEWLIVIINASLSINIASVSVNDVRLSPVSSVGRPVLSVFVCGKCTVAKRLIGSVEGWVY